MKLTRPFLDMLVTRSLWSKMCKSMFLGTGRVPPVGCLYMQDLAKCYIVQMLAYTPGCGALPTDIKSSAPASCAWLTRRKNIRPKQASSTTVYSNRRGGSSDEPPPLKVIQLVFPVSIKFK